MVKRTQFRGKQWLDSKVLQTKPVYLTCKDVSLTVFAEGPGGKIDIIRRLHEAAFETEELPYGLHRKHGRDTGLLRCCPDQGCRQDWSEIMYCEGPPVLRSDISLSH